MKPTDELHVACKDRRSARPPPSTVFTTGSSVGSKDRSLSNPPNNSAATTGVDGFSPRHFLRESDIGQRLADSDARSTCASLSSNRRNELDAHVAARVDTHMSKVRDQLFATLRLLIDEATEPNTLCRLVFSSKEINPLLNSRIRDVANQHIKEAIQSTSWTQFGSEFETMKQAIADESRARCIGDGNLHARLGRDLADMRTRLEETRERLEAADVANRTHWSNESTALRSIVDSVWSRQHCPAQDIGRRFFKIDEIGEDGNEVDGNEPRFKECVGDEGDVLTLFEMVQEALGESVRLSKELEELKAGINPGPFLRDLYDALQRLNQKVEEMQRRVAQDPSLRRYQKVDSLDEGHVNGSGVHPGEPPTEVRSKARIMR